MPETERLDALDKLQNAAAIAASVKPEKSIEHHNLRAWLLLIADGQDPSGNRDPLDTTHWGEMAEAECAAIRFGFALRPLGAGVLTQLGHKVAELLRPKPWTVTTNRGFPQLLHPNGEFAFEAAGELDLCRRIAALLNADELARAKTYQVSEGP